MRQCDKGFPCGQTCIERADNCLHDLQPGGREYLNKLIEIMPANIRQVPPTFAALQTIINSATDAEVESITTFYQTLINKPKADRTGSKQVNLEDVEYFANNQLAKYKKAFEESFDNKGELTLTGTKKYIDSQVKKAQISDKVVSAVWDTLPKNIQTKLKNAGDPRTSAWQNKSTARGQMLLKRYMEQQGIDPYTGRFVDLNDAELEHIIPETVGGAGADHPNNWAWIRADINKWHGNKTATEWETDTKAIMSNQEKYQKKVEKSKADSADQKAKLANNDKALEEAYAVGTDAKTRQQYARQVAESLKTKSKKLISASGLPESYQQLRANLPGTKNRTQSIDNQSTEMVEILQSKQKPSSLLFQALAFTADNPERNQKLREGYQEAIKARTLDFAKSREIYEQQGPATYKDALKAQSQNFAKELKKLFDDIDDFSYN